jgi:hypothetical protein
VRRSTIFSLTKDDKLDKRIYPIRKKALPCGVGAGQSQKRGEKITPQGEPYVAGFTLWNKKWAPYLSVLRVASFVGFTL